MGKLSGKTGPAVAGAWETNNSFYSAIPGSERQGIFPGGSGFT